MEEFNYKVSEVTKRFIEDDFKERFKKTKNSILLEKPFQKVAEHYVRQKVPAYLRTEYALKNNPDAIKLMKRTLDEFLYKIESKELGWQYVLRFDGYEATKLFDESGEIVIDYSYNTSINPAITEEIKAKNFIRRWAKIVENESEEKDD
ncbi:MAG: hypothetical protein NZ903_03160 [Candidatus Micrarchaeota archaeon]|nr:hypothetical protein [Candidatus Micrarchaeota archaeon]